MNRVIEVVIIALILPVAAMAGKHAGDSHYTQAEFFDIHVCNWPERELFFMALFASKEYSDIESIVIFTPVDTIHGKSTPAMPMRICCWVILIMVR